jgi:hypothetical protein
MRIAFIALSALILCPALLAQDDINAIFDDLPELEPAPAVAAPTQHPVACLL